MPIVGVNPISASNSSSPFATCAIDPTSGLVYSPGCANYTAVTTAGTSTIKPTGGIFYGFVAVATGTSFTITPYDIYTTVTGTSTTTTTSQMYATSTAGAATGSINITAGAAGVRINGQLVVVTAGTPGQWNILWD